MRYKIYYSGKLLRTFVSPEVNITGILYFDARNDAQAELKAPNVLQEHMREERLEFSSPPYLRKYEESKKIICYISLEKLPSETIR